jgi:hypothetical protein
MMARSPLLDLGSDDGDSTMLVAEERYWDAVVAGDPTPAVYVDPDFAAVIHRVHALDGAPLPEAEFAARLEAELLGNMHAVEGVPGSPVPILASRPEPLIASSPRPVLVSRRLLSNVAATAALLAIVLASLFVVLRAGPLAPRDRTEPPLVLGPGITDEKLLLQARFDTFPSGSVSASVVRWVLQPGAEMPMSSWRPRASTPAPYQAVQSWGPSAYIIESGTLTVLADNPIAVTHAGATVPITVPEGVPIDLLPGDRAYVEGGVGSLWRNDGDFPVRVMEAAITSRDSTQTAPGVLAYDVISDYSYPKPDRPVVMSVIEITLHPEGMLTADTIPGLAMLKVESGRLVAIDVDGLGNPLPPVELGQATRFLNSFPPGRVFRSGNVEPVKLLLVTIRDANPLGPNA